MSDYEESVPAPRWLLVIVAASAIAMLGVAAVILLADGLATVARVVLAVVLAGSGLAMLFVVRTFTALRIDVTGDAVTFGFGALRKRLPSDEVVAALPDRYPWLRYGGWGIRLSLGGYRAYSQAFERGSVVIETADRHRYHVSSRHPADLAEAINRIATAESARP